MKVKVQDLKPSMLVRHESGKGILKVDSVTPTVTKLYPQQYIVRFAGITESEQVSEDVEFEVLGV